MNQAKRAHKIVNDNGYKIFKKIKLLTYLFKSLNCEFSAFNFYFYFF